MHKLLLGFVLLMSLLLVSCDRFDHTFKPETASTIQQELFTGLQNAFDSATPSDISTVMAFYDPDYLHNGQEKTDRADWFQSLLATDSTAQFQVELIDQQNISPTDTLSLVNWRLLVLGESNQVLADSTFFGDEIIKRGDKWLIYGNRAGCCPPPVYKQRVFIETFTYTTCPNCPVVEALLHQLQIDNPYNLSYLEYHLGDPLDIGNEDVYSYYGYPAMPSVVFQGRNLIIGNNETNEQFFNQLTQQISNTDAQITLSGLDYTLSGQTLSGSVRLNQLDTGVDVSTLKLKYAILDKESTDFTNSAGDPCRNVVMAKGTKALTGIDISQPIAFNLPFTGTLPIDSYLVIWVQQTPDPFNSNASVYNALESYIVTSRKK